MTMVIDVKDVGGIEFPWAPGQTTLAVPPAGGVCSQYSFEDDNALTYIRYATLFFNGSVTNNGDPWVFAATPLATPLIAFSDGVGETANSNTGKKVGGNGANLALTQADTNAEDGGSLVPFSSSWFLTQGMGIEFGSVGLFETTGSFTTSAHLSFYEEDVIRLLADQVTLAMRYENTKIINDMGLARQYPAQSQMSNACDIATVGTPMVGAMMPFTFPWFSGSRCACNLINVVAALQSGCNVKSNTNSPTVSGEWMTARMTIELYGRTFCLDQLKIAAQAGGVVLPEAFFRAPS